MDAHILRQQYLQLLPRLNDILNWVKEQVSDLPAEDFTIETNLKPYSSVQRKVEEDRAHHVSELSDLARGRVFFSAQYDFEDVLRLLKILLEGTIHSIDQKRGKAEHGLEYNGVIHLDLRIGGINFELQVMPIEFQPYKQFLHRIYEQLRDPQEKLTDKQRKLLRKTHNQVYHRLHEKAQANRKSD